MNKDKATAIPPHLGRQDSSPLLTIALPVFNGGTVLDLAVSSLFNQSFSDWELLILDDGSTDGAVDRLPFLDDRRVRVICDGCNKGLAVRLNEAIKQAQGAYFARMDHDDICHPDRFARQIEFLQANPDIDLLATQCLIMDEQEQITGTLPAAITHKDICRHPWQGFYMAHPTWLGKTSWFRTHLYRNPGPYCSEDQELLLRASLVSRYHTLPINLLAYRVRAHTAWQKLLRTRITLAKVQIEYFVERGRYDGALLSCLAAVLRIVRDMLRLLRLLPHKSLRILSNHEIPHRELNEWNTLITNLKTHRGSSVHT